MELNKAEILSDYSLIINSSLIKLNINSVSLLGISNININSIHF